MFDYPSVFGPFADACFSACATMQPDAVTTRLFDFAACRLNVQFWGGVPVSSFTDAIAHRETLPFTDHRATDLTIWVADRQASGLHLPRPFWNWSSLGPLGVVTGIDPADGYASFQQQGNVFTLLDRPNNRALLWADDLTALPEWEHSFPFRTLLHHWLAPTPWVLVHAGGVGYASGGMLLTGPGGSGKSTSTLACIDGGLGYAGDDFVLIDTELGVVHSLYNVAKLEADNLIRFPHWEPLVANRPSMPAQKGQLFMHQHRPEQVLLNVPLRAIGLPHFNGGADTTYHGATPADALLALAPSTMGLLGAGPDTFHKLARLVDQYPIYRLDTGTDLPQIPATVRAILTETAHGTTSADVLTSISQPLISVVIPVYNAGKFVAEALQSVLIQNYPNLEIICVDDGSTDDSATVIDGFGDARIRLIRQPNQGLSVARNVGITASTGEFITFLDADDWWAPDKLNRQLIPFNAEPALQVVLSRTQWVFTEDATADGIVFQEGSQQALDAVMGAGLFRRTVFEQVGLFDTNLWAGQDYDWYNRLREQQIPLRTTDDVVLFYRRHNLNMTNDKHIIKTYLMQVLKMSLDRRRTGLQHPAPAMPSLSALS